MLHHAIKRSRGAGGKQGQHGQIVLENKNQQALESLKSDMRFKSYISFRREPKNSICWYFFSLGCCLNHLTPMLGARRQFGLGKVALGSLGSCRPLTSKGLFIKGFNSDMPFFLKGGFLNAK